MSKAPSPLRPATLRPATVRPATVRPATLRPATPEEVTESLSYALRYQGRKRVYQAAEAMARITAERLVAHLQLCGYVVMRGPPAEAPQTPARRTGRD